MKRGPFGKFSIGALILLNATLLLLCEPCGGFVSPTFIGSSGRHVACSANRPRRKRSNTPAQMSARGGKGDHEVSGAGIKLNKGEQAVDIHHTALRSPEYQVLLYSM